MSLCEAKLNLFCLALLIKVILMEEKDLEKSAPQIGNPRCVTS